MRIFVLIIFLIFFYNPAFTQSKDEFPLSPDLSGRINIVTGGYNANGITDRNQNFEWRISGNPGLTYGDFKLGSNFLLGSFENNLVSPLDWINTKNIRQQFNRYTLMPEYKWIKGYIGHVSPRFAPLIANGQTYLGGGIELEASKLRIGLAYGRLQRAVETDTTINNELPAYERWGYAAKVGFGKSTNYFDIVWSYSKDDPNSIIDSGLLIKPEESLSIGFITKHQIVKKLFFELSGAGSLFSRDLRSSEIDEDDVQLPSWISGFHSQRFSTQLTTAVSSKIEYREKLYSIALGYDRIEPEYSNNGIFQIRDDVQRIYIQSRARLLGSSLNISGRLGFEQNDLSGLRLTQSTRIIGNANVYYRYNKEMGFGLNYSNFSDNSQRTNEMGIDSTSSNTSVNNASVNFNLNKATTGGRHQSNIMFFTSISNRADELNNAFITTVFGVNLNYKYAFTKSNFAVGAGLGVNQSENINIVTHRYAPSIMLYKSFMERKLIVDLRTAYNYSLNNGSPVNSTIRPHLTIRAVPDKQHSIGIQAYYFNVDDQSALNNDFDEIKISINYTYTLP